MVVLAHLLITARERLLFAECLLMPAAGVRLLHSYPLQPSGKPGGTLKQPAVDFSVSRETREGGVCSWGTGTRYSSHSSILKYFLQ